MDGETFPDILFITGAMASGKSTVAQLLAEKLPRSVHLRGDLFRRMIVGGRSEMRPDAPPEALRQLALRYDLACMAAARYAEAGFKVIYQDILMGDDLTAVARRLCAWDLGVVVLDPDAETLARRDRTREKTGYADAWRPDAFRALLHEKTPRIGLWLDNSQQSAEESAAAVFKNMKETRNGVPREERAQVDDESAHAEV